MLDLSNKLEVAFAYRDAYDLLANTRRHANLDEYADAAVFIYEELGWQHEKTSLAVAAYAATAVRRDMYRLLEKDEDYELAIEHGIKRLNEKKIVFACLTATRIGVAFLHYLAEAVC